MQRWDRGAAIISIRITNARSRTMTRRSSSTPAATAPTPIAARPTGSSAATGRAIADESEAIKLDPSEPAYFDNRGLSYAEEGDYDRAIIDYNEAISISPRANFLTNRGNAYQAKGDLSRAIADYDRAIQLNPAFAGAYNNRGAAFHGSGDCGAEVAVRVRGLSPLSLAPAIA